MSFTLTDAKRRFLASEEAAWATEQLQQLVDDSQYNTPDKPSYAHPEATPMSFVEWNLLYLCEHPQINVTSLPVECASQDQDPTVALRLA